MRELPINITKAQIKSFSVVLGEERPEVSVAIGLLTEGGKQIAEYCISTNTWHEENKFELPPSIIISIRRILDELEMIAIKHCRESQMLLGGGNNDRI